MSETRGTAVPAWTQRGEAVPGEVDGRAGQMQYSTRAGVRAVLTLTPLQTGAGYTGNK